VFRIRLALPRARQILAERGRWQIYDGAAGMFVEYGSTSFKQWTHLGTEDLDRLAKSQVVLEDEAGYLGRFTAVELEGSASPLRTSDDSTHHPVSPQRTTHCELSIVLMINERYAAIGKEARVRCIELVSGIRRRGCRNSRASPDTKATVVVRIAPASISLTLVLRLQ
jgi:hypothetical protein